MRRQDHLRERYPELMSKIARLHLANLPTPVEHVQLRGREITVKLDSRSARPYGGNKIRKLEFILPFAIAKGCTRIATFGAVGSHHALATAIYTKQLGLSCLCFLSQQHAAPGISATLQELTAANADIVEFGGHYRTRLNILRRHLWHAPTWVIPLGGSSWRGTLGFVEAGLELAAQVSAGKTAVPERIYIASGTMGSAVGISLGLALAGLHPEIHAVRVSHTVIMNPLTLKRLTEKTASMLSRLTSDIPADLANRCKIVVRNDFFGAGYAHSTPAVEDAIREANKQLSLELEATYTGKAFAALLHDIENSQDARKLKLMYWHTYAGTCASSQQPLADVLQKIPASFHGYLDDIAD